MLVRLEPHYHLCVANPTVTMYTVFWGLWRLSFMMTSLSHFPTIYKPHHLSLLSTSLVLLLWQQTMTSTIDPAKIGKPVRIRRHVRTLTGIYYIFSLWSHRLCCSSLWPQDIFPRKTRRGKTNGQGVRRRSGEMVCEPSIGVSLRQLFFCLRSPSQLQMLIRSRSLLLTMYKRHLLVSATILVRPFLWSFRRSYSIPLWHPDDLGAYQAAALAVRDDLLVMFNCVSGAYIHLSPLKIGSLERNSAELYS